MAFTGKIKCTSCNKSFGVREDIYNQRIKNYDGSEEKLLKEYKCRACRKGCPAASNTTSTLNKVKTTSKPISDLDKLRVAFPFTGPRKVPMSEIIRTGPEVCYRVDIISANNGYCNGCPYFAECKYTKKALKDESTQTKKAKK